jgi:hypothetical protein
MGIGLTEKYFQKYPESARADSTGIASEICG